MSQIQRIHAREVLDSRGFPTVEVEVTVPHLKYSGESVTGRAIVPSGASTGEGEALELRDGDARRFLGKGTLRAVANVKDIIAPALVGREFSLPSQLDDALRKLDGTPNKAKLGANSLLAVSMAFVQAQALQKNMSVAETLAQQMGKAGKVLPVPLMNILNGGKHADNGLAIQEFMIVPAGFNTFSDALRAGVEIFHRLKKILHDRGLSTAVGDEGGFAPQFVGERAHEQALNSVMDAIAAAGYKAGSQIFLALDSAASEFGSAEKGYLFEGKTLTSEQMVEQYERWTREFPIISIEDGLAEGDWNGWEHLTQKLGKKCQLVGDDLFVTNPLFLKKGIDAKIANAILIKVNQIGTVTETLETMRMAEQAGYRCISSHRSGETEDTFIADLAVGSECGQIKTGSGSRTDRMAKYNQLLRHEERLGASGQFAGLKVFEKFL